MTVLTKLHKKHRLRYKIYFPDGVVKERSRLYSSAVEARMKNLLAQTLEAFTSQISYVQSDVVKWSHAGLLSANDRDALAARLPGQGKTLSKCLDEWETTWTVGSEEEQTRYYRRKKILRILDDKPIKEFTFTDGLDLIKELKKTQKIATIRKYIQDLKAAFNHQVALRYLDYNPVITLSAGRIPAEEKIKHVILTHAQIRVILLKARTKDQEVRPALGGTLYLHLLFFFGTGLRRREAMESKLEHIDWEKRSITLPETITKTGKTRTVGLGARLYAELLPRKDQVGYILPRYRPWSVSRAIRKHLRECGTNARLHDARHTYASMLQDTGVKPHDAMKRTGHTNLGMLSHYSHGDFKEVYEDKFDFLKDDIKEGR
uniref:Putative site-specific tyrosine recombinase n=1 Tax=viral metagenome TaxID=1070528 RepID=A0A6M3J3E5_9ZZZZ